MTNEKNEIATGRRAAATVDRNAMTVSERGGELVGVAAILLVTAFFAYHQLASTGFFTSAFGPLEAFLFYGAAAVTILASSVRAITGKKDNNSRSFELASAVFWATTSLWLLVVFPFNFAFLTTALPASLRFLLSWVSNEVGWVILLLSTLGSLGTAIYTIGRIAKDRATRGRAHPTSRVQPLQ